MRRLRIERGLSQEELAHLSRMDRTWVGGIERGEENPSYEKLVDLASALDVRISELIIEADDG